MTLIIFNMKTKETYRLDSPNYMKGFNSKLRNLLLLTSFFVSNVVNAEDDYDFSDLIHSENPAEESVSKTNTKDKPLQRLNLDSQLLASNSQKFGYQDPYKEEVKNRKKINTTSKENNHNFDFSSTLGSVFGSNSAFYDYDETNLSLAKLQGSMSISADGYKMQSSTGFLGVSLIDSTELIAEGLFLSLVIDSENFVSKFHLNQTLEFYNLSLEYKNPNLNITFLTNQSFGGEKSVIGLDLHSKSLDELFKYLSLNAKILRNQDGKDILNLDINTALGKFIDINVSKNFNLSLDGNISLNFSKDSKDLMGGLFVTISSK